MVKKWGEGAVISSEAVDLAAVLKEIEANIESEE